MIPLTPEPKQYRSLPPEVCYFCKAVTRHWHEPTNTPVCESCAGTHAEFDLTPHMYHIVYGGRKHVEARSMEEAYQTFWLWVKEQVDAGNFGLIVQVDDEEGA